MNSPLVASNETLRSARSSPRCAVLYRFVRWEMISSLVHRLPAP
jgi:hypothetical protein